MTERGKGNVRRCPSGTIPSLKKIKGWLSLIIKEGKMPALL